MICTNMSFPTEEEVKRNIALVVETMKEVKTLSSKELTPEELKKKREGFLAMNKTLTIEQQCEEMKKNANTPMTYAEMRERFG